VRIQYQARFGDNYLASALGRVDVVQRASVHLLREIDRWLDDFRRKCAAGRDKEEAPKRILCTLNAIDSAIFEFCKYDGPRLFQDIVIALGRAERELAVTEGKFKKKTVNPIPQLSPNWLGAAADGSAEFAIARALASLHDPEAKIGPLRANLEPVDWNKNCRAWAKEERCVVWNAADLATNLVSVLQRRMMDGARRGGEHLPLASRFTASLGTVAAFIAGDLDDQRTEDLIWGLMLIDGRHGWPARESPTNPPSQSPSPLKGEE
jgi:CRISPR-associated protein Csx17